nr:hypothetical protein CoNPh37_CDS0098 [Staphylococcus phage S-CoN_Ph37]
MRLNGIKTSLIPTIMIKYMLLEIFTHALQQLINLQVKTKNY